MVRVACGSHPVGKEEASLLCFGIVGKGLVALFGKAALVLGGLVVAFLVMIAGVELLKSSITRVFHPEDIEFSVLMFVILIISVVVKASMAGFYLISGKKIGSPTILAAAADSRNDVISTSSVLIASFISYHFGVNLDGYMGMFVAAFILVSGIDIVKDTIKPLLGTTPSEELVNEMEQKILSYEGVLGTHDLMVHDYGPGHCFASVHVEVPAERNVLECHELIDKIEQDFEEEKGIHLVIHYDPIVTSDEEVGSIRSYLKKEATKIDSSLSIHDLRIVPGEKNTNVIFDCVIPMSLKKEENRICEELKNKLTEKYPDHTAVIKIDHSFVAVNK